MAKITFIYSDDEYDVSITVRKATFGDGINRVLLGRVVSSPPTEADVAALADADTIMDTFAGMKQFASSIVRTTMYPACICATDSITNNDASKPCSADINISPEKFVGLPEDLVSEWLEAVYTLNPHWQLKEPDEEDDLGEASEPGDSNLSIPDSLPGSSPSDEVAVT